MTAKVGSLAGALAAVQRKLPDVRKSETAKVETRNGRSYEYKYADLAAISRQVLPLLAEHDLVWICRPTLNAERQFVLAYELGHVSGERVIGEYPLPASGSAQELGSAITYARRYALCSVTGLAPDDDDDGAAAQGSAKSTRSRRSTAPAAAAEIGTTVPVEVSAMADTTVVALTITERQSKRMHTLFTEARITDRGERLAFVAEVIGRDITSSKELTRTEAAQVIAALEAGLTEPKEQQP